MDDVLFGWSSATHFCFGALLEQIAQIPANRRIVVQGETVLPLFLNFLLVVPIPVIYIWQFRSTPLYAKKVIYATDYDKNPLFDITLAPLTEWIPLTVIILGYFGAVLIIGAVLWSKWWPKRRQVLDSIVKRVMDERDPRRRPQRDITKPPDPGHYGSISGRG